MNIAIAGFGVEGQENYAYWSQDSGNTITIVDENLDPSTLPAGLKSLTGAGVFEQLQGFDLVVRTPSLSPHRIKTNGKVWSATNEFFEKCPAPIIGVTGSKGKGTTSSLIASILETSGKKVWLVGNIGTPALSVLPQVQPEDIVVYELSSFQLWDLEKDPHVAVVLFIEQEHLDVHQSMEEYVQAKARIAWRQTENDVLVYNAENTYAQQIADGSVAQKIAFPHQSTAHIKDNAFYYGDQQICSTDELRVKGAHNHSNALAAIDAAWQYTQDFEAIAEGLRRFGGLPHRLAYVATVNGIEYYDDSIATTPAAAIAALRAFEGRKKVIILGGSSKGSDFSALAEELTKHEVRALLIGDEAKTIAKACEQAGFTHYEYVTEPKTGETITEAYMQRVVELAEEGSVVLLSPAAASFGLFKNYADRGEQFIAAVGKPIVS